jgi:hypothetical protein
MHDLSTEDAHAALRDRGPRHGERVRNGLAHTDKDTLPVTVLQDNARDALACAVHPAATYAAAYLGAIHSQPNADDG